MTVAATMTESLTEEEKALLGNVPETGSSIGNVSLIRALKWPETQYWEVRDKLLEKGMLEKGRGYGGSVHRITTDDAQSGVGTETGLPPILDSNVRRSEPENILYAPVAKELSEKWTKDNRLEDFVLDITAVQGGRDTGGTWSRPDIVVVSVVNLPFVPGKHLDVTSFEIKPWNQLDVTAVYEALAHLRAVTRSFVFLHVPIESENDVKVSVETIFDECNRQGIGLIVAEDPGDYGTWDIRAQALRRETDPVRLNDFVAQQLSPESKQKIQKWCR
jgi:hypothetical protein